ncbi:hypothetical protein CYLTODRAFT_443777 [Cylindrobasidium torrendii FP15055 ss-10]|uniref:MYND-type domain-containing protein n=1 Tax=Cylindrobasidium torrendii FP15055 ss-10 TaxID=1314674 RepID=A0A0D7BBC9_9AGAR|nr:hypothetical protein CYLTODRAFT_443777 [Cylindrobasidium torrendii FP15055 ss-10]
MAPKPPIPEYPSPTTCRAFFCEKEATQACSRCKGGSQRSRYCSVKCQTADWKLHKKYCGKTVYTFKIELLGSRDPVITRVVDVPAWYTFQELHFVIQYAFGPWQQVHLHEFSYKTGRPNRSGGISFAPDTSVLRIRMDGEQDELPEFAPKSPQIYESQIKLSDVYDAEGKHRAKVLKNGEVLPLEYLYDFGDNWEHRLTFKGERMASAARPLFASAVGYPPAEDAGGVSGWEEVKEAFAATNPTPDQISRRKWAISRMNYESRTDPLAVGENVPYSPFNEVNVTVMNYDGRWENHLEGYKEQLKYSM